MNIFKKWWFWAGTGIAAGIAVSRYLKKRMQEDSSADIWCDENYADMFDEKEFYEKFLKQQQQETDKKGEE